MIEHAFDVVLLLDRDFGVLYASPSVERVLGYAPRELVGRNGLDFIHPDQLEDARKQFATALVSQDSVFTSERLIQHKYGTWLWTENTMTNLLGEPSVRAFVVNLRDISGRKQAEKALRESEQRFRDYTETASDWFWESARQHLSVHPAGCEHAGRGLRPIAIAPGLAPDKAKDDGAPPELV